MIRSWVREALRGGAASLIVPGILLAAALLVSAGGGGAGALGSLDQLASGPDLPAPSIDGAVRPTDDGSRGLENELLATINRGAPAAGEAANGGGRRAAPPASGPGGGASAPSRRSPAPPSVSGGGGGGGGSGSPAAREPRPAASKRPAPTAPPEPPRRPLPKPVTDVVDQTRRLGDELTKPLEPLTDELLRGLRRRR